jgi:hypothetical protein
MTIRRRIERLEAHTKAERLERTAGPPLRLEDLTDAELEIIAAGGRCPRLRLPGDEWSHLSDEELKRIIAEGDTGAEQSPLA